MATINFLYRSARELASLNLRLLFTHNEKPHAIGGKTNLIVSKDYWKNTHNKKIRKDDIDLKNEQTKIKEKLLKLETYILNEFDETDIEDVNKDWLKNQLESYYNPKQAVKIPKKLIPFFEYYLDVKSNELTASRVQTIKAVQRKLERFEKSNGHHYAINEINDSFRKQFVDYCRKEQYSISTLVRDVKLVKTICLFANYKDVPIHKELSNLKVETKKNNEDEELSHGIEEHYLSFEELDQIKAFDLSDNERLNNVRDWLLISCYTGQRISDFMRFDTSMIEKKKGKHLLTFKQQKTSKPLTIPFLDEAREIVNKNKGKFPRPISHQKYNDYLKELCKLAGINTKIKGSIIERVSSSKTKTRNDYRRIKGTFEKWELVSSHIGRRSFATNFYGKVPTSVLIGITAHSTEQIFLQYIRKNETDTAIDAFKYFE